METLTEQTDEHCEAVFDRLSYQYRKDRHLKCGLTFKHRHNGVSFTDAGAARVAAEKLKESKVPIKA